ncbi:MAG: hypothetical protein IPN34_26585 [Planctomycetes bacterium]|nr:hypothetical protein [Planctomycetota bacterium]
MHALRIPIVPLEGSPLFPGCEAVVESDRAYIERLRQHAPTPRDVVALVTWDRTISETPTPAAIRTRGVIARIAILPYEGDRAVVAVEGSEAIQLSAIEMGEDGVLHGIAESVAAPIARRAPRAG